MLCLKLQIQEMLKVKAYLLVTILSSQAFQKKVDGTFEYLGDRGTHSLQISESMTVATSLDGGTAFETVDTGKGRKSTFEIISNTINAISTASVSRQGSAAAYAALDFEVPRDPQNWSFTLLAVKVPKQLMLQSQKAN